MESSQTGFGVSGSYDLVNVCPGGVLTMRYFRPSYFLSGLLSLTIPVLLTGCGSSGSTTHPPTQSYTVTASGLTPSSVTQGASATSTISLSPANGYTGSIKLSCSGITGGSGAPTCSFNPSMVTISGSSAVTSALTVSTTASTAPGNYSITVSASDTNGAAPSNSLPALSLAVVSNLTPGYSLGTTTLSPGTVTAGNSGTSNITVTPTNGYGGSVALSCSSITGGSPEPTCSFNPATVTISGTAAKNSTLTVSTTTSTPGGSYTIAVSGKDANNLGPSDGSQRLSMTTSAVIKNVVIIFQENRTPDNLFYGLCTAPYGSPNQCAVNAGVMQYEIQTSNWVNNQVSGGVTQPQKIDLGTSGNAANPDNYDLGHSHNDFKHMCDLNTTTNTCQMDGADLIATTCTKGTANCPPPPNPEFYYVDPADVVPYLQMAQAYTFGDHMFQTNEGPSFPAHQFILGGTSEPSTGSPDFVSENVLPSKSSAGCLASAVTTNTLIDPQGVETVLHNNSGQLCNDHQTLTDLLDDASIGWRYYTPSDGSIWTAPSAIQHMCVPNPPAPNATKCSGPDYTAAAPAVVLSPNQATAPILSDISNSQLRQVSWVIPAGQYSDHALSNTGCGPSWVTSIVNAIGTSPYWSNTVIIIAWDDWGGWYDHVPPPRVIDDGTSWGSGYVYGFRVPLLVISPYAKRSYISKVPHDFGSILKFIENTYNLPSLGVADANALDDLSDVFQFTSPPTAFSQFTPPYNNSTCQSDPSAPLDPDDD